MLQSVGEERLLSSSSEKLLQLEEEQSVEIGATCSQKVAARYQDSRCMDTTTNASVPDRLTQQKYLILMKHTLGNVMMQSQTNHCLNDLVVQITLFLREK